MRRAASAASSGAIRELVLNGEPGHRYLRQGQARPLPERSRHFRNIIWLSHGTPRTSRRPERALAGSLEPKQTRLARPGLGPFKRWPVAVSRREQAALLEMAELGSSFGSVMSAQFADYVVKMNLDCVLGQTKFRGDGFVLHVRGRPSPGFRFPGRQFRHLWAAVAYVAGVAPWLDGPHVSPTFLA